MGSCVYGAGEAGKVALNSVGEGWKKKNFQAGSCQIWRKIVSIGEEVYCNREQSWANVEMNEHGARVPGNSPGSVWLE